MARKRKSRKSHPFIRVSLWLVFAGLVAGIIILFRIYKSLFFPSVDAGGKDVTYFYIKTGSNYEEVFSDLVKQDIVTDKRSFEWLAKKKKFESNINPGRYKIIPKMTNNELINLLRSGRQTPLMVTFNNVRNLEQLAGIISKQLEPDSSALSRVINNPEIFKKYGFNDTTFISMFLPNSYEFYWTTTPERFVDRLHSEYLVFWAKGREAKAEKIGLTPLEVTTLASIVDLESLHDDENPRIAGVFMNRLRSGIPLQSDPTIIFAWNDYNIRRVLNKHKTIKSPYNTYIHRNLPPGPISIPSISAIDAVLNYEKNDYLYFCAKDDFSGYHNFARTLTEHLKNARMYQKALNQKKIFK